MEQHTPTSEIIVTPRSTGVRYGLIAGVISIVFFLVLVVADIIGEGYWNWLGFLITFVIVFLAHQYFKENSGGLMSYGEGIIISLWIGLVSASISSVFTYIYTKFIDSSFSQMMKDKQIEAMQQKGMSEEQITQAMSFVSWFATPEAMLILGLIFGVIGTIIVGLIVSIFTQKKPPETAF